MADLPIIYSGPMVCALLADRKTQTRRLSISTRKTHPTNTSHDTYQLPSSWQKVKPGDRLWVREVCRAVERESDAVDGVLYAADKAWMPIENTRAAADLWVDLFNYRKQRGAIIPPIHMPRWASRLTLIVESVKAERLEEISEADAIAEGVEHAPTGNAEVDKFYKCWRVGLGPQREQEMRGSTAADCFLNLWEFLHGEGSVAENPEVVAITFKVIKQNIDRIVA